MAEEKVQPDSCSDDDTSARFVAKWLVADPSTFDGADSMSADVLNHAREIIRQNGLANERLRGCFPHVKATEEAIYEFMNTPPTRRIRQPNAATSE